MPKGHPISVPELPWERTKPPEGPHPRPANACGHWTKLGTPIRHKVCRNLPLTECHYK